MSTVLRIVEASSAPRNYIARPRPHSSQKQLSQMTEESSCSRKTFGHILAACEWGKPSGKRYFREETTPKPYKNQVFWTARRRRRFFWSISPYISDPGRKSSNIFPPYFGPWWENSLFSHHFPNPGGKLEKAVSHHCGGEKIPLVSPLVSFQWCIERKLNFIWYHRSDD